MGPSPAARLVARDLVFTNAATSVGLGRATASFTFGADGVGCAMATNRLVIAVGSRLAVDASALVGGGESWHPLITYETVEGAFDPAHISLVKPVQESNRTAEIVQATHKGTNGYWLRVPRGLMLIVR